jgi:hypothetical protein
MAAEHQRGRVNDTGVCVARGQLRLGCDHHAEGNDLISADAALSASTMSVVDAVDHLRDLIRSVI